MEPRTRGVLGLAGVAAGNLLLALGSLGGATAVATGAVVGAAGAALLAVVWRREDGGVDPTTTVAGVAVPRLLLAAGAVSLAAGAASLAL